MSNIKHCFYTGCSNTTENAPSKIFVSVPKNTVIRKRWFESAGKTGYTIPTTGNLYCCEDHFDLENDCENWIYFKTMGSNLIIKKDVVPRNTGRCLRSDESQLSKSAEKRKTDALKDLEEASSSGMNVRRKLFVSEDDVFTPTKRPKTSRTVVSPSGTFKVTKMSVTRLVKSTQTVKPDTRSFGVNVSFKKRTVDKAVNTIILRKEPIQLQKENKPESSTDTEISSSEQYAQSASSSNGNKNLGFAIYAKNTTVHKIERNPRLYTGIPKDSYFIINLLTSSCPRDDILLTLKKIRTNDAFSRIADDFDYSPSNVSKIFAKTVPVLAAHLRELIIWPSPEKIASQLPPQFWASYKNVQSIIDCFEVQIQKPSGSVNQALTWSQYKSANTVKYLISATPDGLINFASRGFTGRTSDKEILSQCGYLDVLPRGSQVLADRGFKQVASLLENKNCELVRPPSVHAHIKPSKQEVQQAKLVASLRVHIERVIRRVREFKMLSPHACIPTALLKYLDYIVIIACAIVNLQGPIIKQ